MHSLALALRLMLDKQHKHGRQQHSVSDDWLQHASAEGRVMMAGYTLAGSARCFNGVCLLCRGLTCKL